MSVHAELISAENYTALASELRLLQNQSLSPNIFADPALVLAAAPHFKLVKVALAREGGRLVGAWPVFSDGKMLHARGHQYMMLSTPVLAKGYELAALKAIVDALKIEKSLPRYLHIAYADIALIEMLKPILPVRYIVEQTRGVMLAQGDAQEFFKTVLSVQARRSLQKQQRKMEKIGGLAFEMLEGSAAVQALPRFLELEARGWKGKGGTAIAKRQADRAFVTAAYENLQNGDALLSRLVLNGAPLAIGLVLRCAGHAWFWKIAYDESAARLSPGVHYAKALCEDCIRWPDFVEADSCAPLHAGRHVMFCRTPRRYLNVLVSLDETPSLMFKWRAAKMLLAARVKALIKIAIGRT